MCKNTHGFLGGKSWSTQHPGWAMFLLITGIVLLIIGLAYMDYMAGNATNPFTWPFGK